MRRTLNSLLSSAELCRINHWSVGTIIRGEKAKAFPEADQSPRDLVQLQITAIGIRTVVALDLDTQEEQTWNLTCREWLEVPA